MWLARSILALSLLAPSPRSQQPPPAPVPSPTREQVEATCRRLEEVLVPSADPATAREALKAAIAVVHADVIARIDARGLRHADASIREAAVEALARMDHPDALAALTAVLKRDGKALAEDPPRHAALLKAIGRHGKESSIPLLVKDLFQSTDRGVVTARIFGLGHIRSRASVDELMQIMRSAPRGKGVNHMPELRTALVVLTGVDKGTDQALWLNWYGDNKNSLAIAPAPPAELPRDVQRRWDSYWGTEERPAKREREPPK